MRRVYKLKRREFVKKWVDVPAYGIMCMALVAGCSPQEEPGGETTGNVNENQVVKLCTLMRSVSGATSSLVWQYLGKLYRYVG
jgi:hypothetical protein